MSMTLIKLGGSTMKSPNLKLWIQAIEQAIEPVVVVPGGGPFADAVRRYQTQLGYSDKVAHEMAILAMEQFGCILLGLSNRFVAARTLDEIEGVLAIGQIPVWLPRRMVMEDADIPQNWTTTSDSLAAWLQRQTKADNLCLVKLIDVPSHSTVEALSRAAIVDEAFPSMVSREGRFYVAGPSDLPTAGRRFAVGGIPGRLISSPREVVCWPVDEAVAAE